MVNLDPLTPCRVMSDWRVVLRIFTPSRDYSSASGLWRRGESFPRRASRSQFEFRWGITTYIYQQEYIPQRERYASQILKTELGFVCMDVFRNARSRQCSLGQLLTPALGVSLVKPRALKPSSRGSSHALVGLAASHSILDREVCHITIAGRRLLTPLPETQPEPEFGGACSVEVALEPMED